jgi:Rieske Fe-S protein
VFDATRVKPLAGAKSFISENIGTGAELVGGYLQGERRSLDELPVGEAAIVKLNGQRAAVFRDESGRVHTVSAVCTHMGCVLGWNPLDRTWDCPCHGSRFALDGSVIHGPATTSLERIPVP